MGMTVEQLEKEIEKLSKDEGLQEKVNKNVDQYDKTSEDYSLRGKPSYGAGLTRAVGQGLSFGFGDEIEAAFSSIGSDQSYEQHLKAIRDKIESFKETNPMSAYGGEIVGSIASSLTGAGLVGKGVQAGTKLATAGKVGQLGTVGKAIGTGAVEGGLYGAGSAEEGNRLKGAGIGATMGGGMAGTFASILPRSSEAAKKLLDKKVPLTVGQEFTEGPGGKLISGLEQTLTSYPGAGGAIAGAREKALNKFNKIVMSEALDPILSKGELNQFLYSIRTKTGNEAFEEMKDVISRKYTDILDNMTIPKEGLDELQTSFKTILKDNFGDMISKQNQKIATKTFNSEFEKVLSRADGETVMTGENLKRFETFLKNKSKQYQKIGGTEAEIGNAFSETLDSFRNVINKHNDGQALKNVNKAYAAYIPIKLATLKANKTKGVFSTSQFLNAIKDADQSLGKVNTAKGKNIFKDLPDLGQEVLGKTIPDSGTASRIVGGNIIGGKLDDLVRTYGTSVIADLLYSRPGQMGIKGLLKGSGGLAQGISPYTASGVSSSLLAPEKEETQDERLQKYLYGGS